MKSSASAVLAVIAALSLFTFNGCGGHKAAAHRQPSRVPPSQPSSSGNSSPSGGATGTPAKHPPRPAIRQNEPLSALGQPYVEEGVASWYGIPFHGRRASNGEVYDMYKMTAAHRTLPFDTILRVTNLKNGMSTEIRVIDRGPFVEGRILDLSLAAARAIDMVGMGIAPVRIEVLNGPDPFTGSFTVQVGAFRMQENAVKFQQRMEQRYSTASVAPLDSPQGTLYRVRVGKLPSEAAALAFADQLSQEQNVVPFVVRLDEAPPTE